MSVVENPLLNVVQSLLLSVSPLRPSLIQADVCHAYQILHAHGVPDDHIVVMMFNDIAYNEE